MSSSPSHHPQRFDERFSKHLGVSALLGPSDARGTAPQERRHAGGSPALEQMRWARARDRGRVGPGLSPETQRSTVSPVLRDLDPREPPCLGRPRNLLPSPPRVRTQRTLRLGVAETLPAPRTVKSFLFPRTPHGTGQAGHGTPRGPRSTYLPFPAPSTETNRRTETALGAGTGGRGDGKTVRRGTPPALRTDPEVGPSEVGVGVGPGAWGVGGPGGNGSP